MSLYTQGLTAAAAGYSGHFTCPASSAIQLTVMNAAVLIELGDGVGTPLWRSGESFRLPGVHVIPGPVDAIRVRAAAAIVAGNEPRYAIDAT